MNNINATAIILIDDINHLKLSIKYVLSSQYVKNIILIKKQDFIGLDSILKYIDTNKSIEIVNFPLILNYATNDIKTAYSITRKYNNTDIIVKLDDDILWTSPKCIDTLIEYIYCKENIAIASPYIVNSCFCNGISSGKNIHQFKPNDFHQWYQSGKFGIKHIIDFIDGKIHPLNKDFLYKNIELSFGKTGPFYFPELPFFCCRYSNILKWISNYYLYNDEFYLGRLLNKFIFQEEKNIYLNNVIVSKCMAVKLAYEQQKIYANVFDKDITKIMNYKYEYTQNNK